MHDRGVDQRRPSVLDFHRRLCGLVRRWNFHRQTEFPVWHTRGYDQPEAEAVDVGRNGNRIGASRHSAESEHEFVALRRQPRDAGASPPTSAYRPDRPATDRTSRPEGCRSSPSVRWPLRCTQQPQSPGGKRSVAFVRSAGVPGNDACSRPQPSPGRVKPPISDTDESAAIDEAQRLRRWASIPRRTPKSRTPDPAVQARQTSQFDVRPVGRPATFADRGISAGIELASSLTPEPR